MDSVGTLPPDALSRAVVEIEKHVSSAGWDQPAQLFALVPTADLLRAEPHLAAELGAEDASQPLTPVAQGELPGGVEDDHLADTLARIEWPDGVAGCALAIERIVLPAAAESGLSSVESDAELARLAGSDPRRHEVRMVAAVLREGTRFGAVRLRCPRRGQRSAHRYRLGPHAVRSTVFDIRTFGRHPVGRGSWGRRHERRRGEATMSDGVYDMPEEPPARSEPANRRTPTCSAADDRHTDRPAHPLQRLHRRLDPAALVPIGRPRLGVQHRARHPCAAVRDRRSADGGRGRRERHRRLPHPSPGGTRPVAEPRLRAVRRSAAAAREDRGRRRRDPDADLRRLGSVGGVEGLPGLAEPDPVRRHRQALQQGHRVLRLRLPVAARAARLRLLDRLAVAGRRDHHALPVRRLPPVRQGPEGLRRGAGAVLGAARPPRPAQGLQLLARPVRSHDLGRQAVHRYVLHRRPCGPAEQGDPGRHRGPVCGLVLRQRGPQRPGCCPASARSY